MIGLLGKKVGMTSIFLEGGANVACTVIEASPNYVTQVKTEESDGYEAVQIAFGDRKAKNTTKAMQGHFAKAGVDPKHKVIEIRDCSLDVSMGEAIDVSVFNEGDKIDVVGTSKGKGFQGVVKRHGFGGVGQATHGQHNRLRAPGAIGACSYPARVFKGTRMAGRMGNDRVTVRNLQVMKIFADQNLLLVKGAIPGSKGSYVLIEKK